VARRAVPPQATDELRAVVHGARLLAALGDARGSKIQPCDTAHAGNVAVLPGVTKGMRSISPYFEATCYAWVGLIGLRPPARPVHDGDDRASSAQPARRRGGRRDAGFLYSLTKARPCAADRDATGTDG
jgi:hypothetical protein